MSLDIKHQKSLEDEVARLWNVNRSLEDKLAVRDKEVAFLEHERNQLITLNATLQYETQLSIRANLQPTKN